MKLDILLNKLKTLRVEKRPIIIAGVGCGLTARAAVMGGADLLAVYSTAIYRVRGLPTTLSFLPYDNANDITFATAPDVLANAGDVPVLFGLGAHDPRIPPIQLVDKAISCGASGVLNEPFIGVYGSYINTKLDENECGFDREVELIDCAVKNGLLALAWVFNENQATIMSKIGAHIIGSMVIMNISKQKREKNSDGLQKSIDNISCIVNVVKSINNKAFVLGHGGHLNYPSDLAQVMEQTRMDGFFSGSTSETIPIEKEVAKTINQFKKMVE